VQKTWKPNRKVVAGAVAGLVSLGVFVTLGPDANPEIGSAVTLTVMTVISYIVPLADEDPAAG
jgi:DNA-directed RNA polymerase subunit E'/Rpb7